MSVYYDTAQAFVFLLVSLCCDTAQALAFLLVSVCCDTAQASVFLLVSLCCNTAHAKALKHFTVALVFLLVTVCCDTAQASAFLLLTRCCDTAQAKAPSLIEALPQADCMRLADLFCDWFVQEKNFREVGCSPSPPRPRQHSSPPVETSHTPWSACEWDCVCCQCVCVYVHVCACVCVGGGGGGSVFYVNGIDSHAYVCLLMMRFYADCARSTGRGVLGADCGRCECCAPCYLPRRWTR